MTNSAARIEADARRFGRHSAKLPALLYCHGRFQRVTIVNVSQGGARVEGAFGVMPPDKVKLELLDQRQLKGVAVWAIGAKLGIAFDAVLAADDALLDTVRFTAPMQPDAEGERRLVLPAGRP